MAEVAVSGEEVVRGGRRRRRGEAAAFVRLAFRPALDAEVAGAGSVGVCGLCERFLISLPSYEVRITNEFISGKAKLLTGRLTLTIHASHTGMEQYLHRFETFVAFPVIGFGAEHLRNGLQACPVPRSMLPDIDIRPDSGVRGSGTI